MFFCKIAKIVGILGVILGLTRAGMGLLVTFFDTPTAAAAEYLGSKSAGQAIDQGILWFVAAVVIGALGEIGVLLARQRE